MVLLASDEVEGLGGREARKSPYAGDSCSLTSVIRKVPVRAYKRGMSTIYCFALREVAIILTSKKTIPISTDNAFDVTAGVSVCFSKMNWRMYPPFTLKRRPSMTNNAFTKSELRDVEF